MNLYRHKENQMLYTLEHLILDNKHLNQNAFSGIYATPFNWNGETIKYTKANYADEVFNPMKFVEDNFEVIAEFIRL